MKYLKQGSIILSEPAHNNFQFSVFNFICLNLCYVTDSLLDPSDKVFI
jgi:hypothetical protein